MPGTVYRWVNVAEEWARNRWLLGVLNEAEDCLAKGNVIWVHCLRGKHRTAAFCAVIFVMLSPFIEDPPPEEFQDPRR